MKVLHVLGTRPETIKFAPVIHALAAAGIDQSICLTGQQRELTNQMLGIFGLTADFDLAIMRPQQSLEQITTNLLTELPPVISKVKPTLVLVQGDTSSAFVGALCAYYQKLPVGHIEAGLRSHNKYHPFPEEVNRRAISAIADLHFAPTQTAANNLQAENIPNQQIVITGNTVIDALLWVLKQNRPFENARLADCDPLPPGSLLVTAHRRENLGDDMKQIFAAVKRLASDYPQSKIVFPVHPNPAIGQPAKQILAGQSNVMLLPPLSYSDLARVMQQVALVLTDSGGIQEEAPALGKPVLVLRQTTERPEGVTAGTALVVGTNSAEIYGQAKQLLSSNEAYQRMARAVNPYGDGTAAVKIVETIKERYD